MVTISFKTTNIYEWNACSVQRACVRRLSEVFGEIQGNLVPCLASQLLVLLPDSTQVSYVFQLPRRDGIYGNSGKNRFRNLSSKFGMKELKRKIQIPSLCVTYLKDHGIS